MSHLRAESMFDLSAEDRQRAWAGRSTTLFDKPLRAQLKTNRRAKNLQDMASVVSTEYKDHSVPPSKWRESRCPSIPLSPSSFLSYGPGVPLFSDFFQSL
jgi:hypothetical protein